MKKILCMLLAVLLLASLSTSAFADGRQKVYEDIGITLTYTDEFNEEDRMWGVYQFKRGLGGDVVITPGAWDLPLQKKGYDLFIHSLPKFIAMLKKLYGKKAIPKKALAELAPEDFSLPESLNDRVKGGSRIGFFA